MIQQHYYTRERKGIFSKTPGYDTVAKSKELEEDFIIDTLHGLCFYEAPASLAGEEDPVKYPRAFFCVNTEDNKMVIGQSVFAGKDYTGQRNRYFTHNYIISETEREEYIRNPEKIIYSSGFVSDYNIEKGAIIPEVSQINSKETKLSFNSIEDMFKAVGMNSGIFKNIIKASFHGAKTNKKIYIVLDSENNNITELAKEILKYLYRGLPFAVRKKIGFMTYMKEPKIKDLINIVFLCKGSIKRITTEIKAGYLFDLPDKNFQLDEIEEEKHTFIDFVMDNIEDKETLNEFFDKADRLCIENSLSLSQYDKILQPIEEKFNYVENEGFDNLSINGQTSQNNSAAALTSSSENNSTDTKYMEESYQESSVWKKSLNFIKRIKDSFSSH